MIEGPEGGRSLSLSELRRLAESGDKYREFDLDSDIGKVRHIEDPCHALKVVQAKLAQLLGRIAPPDYLHCPVRGRSYVSNAARHMGNRVVRSLDIKKYFPNTPSRRVYWFYKNVLCCPKDISGLLTALTTYNGHLPTGSPLSPVAAFFAHYDIWQEIGAYCAENSLTLSVYVDDCTVSGARVSGQHMWAIKQIIHRAGLRYHKEKAYFDRPAEVTGVIVRGRTLQAPNRQLRKLKAARDDLQKNPERDDLRSRALGLAGQVGQITKAST